MNMKNNIYLCKMCQPGSKVIRRLETMHVVTLMLAAAVYISYLEREEFEAVFQEKKGCQFLILIDVCVFKVDDLFSMWVMC